MNNKIHNLAIIQLTIIQENNLIQIKKVKFRVTKDLNRNRAKEIQKKLYKIHKI